MTTTSNYLADLNGKEISTNGTIVSPRRNELNLIAGANVTISGVDNAALNRTDVTISTTPGTVGSGSETGQILAWSGSAWVAGRTISKATIAAGVAAGVIVHNPTAAALGAPQYSPSIVQQGEGWETTGGTRREVYTRTQVRGIQGASVDTQYVISLGNAAEGTAPDSATLTDELVLTTSALDIKDNALLTTGTVTASFLHARNSAADPNSASVQIFKSRGGGTVLNGDSLGAVNIYAHDGTSELVRGQLIWFVTGAVSTGTVPTSAFLSTGSSSLITRSTWTETGTQIHNCDTGGTYGWQINSVRQVDLSVNAVDFHSDTDANFSLKGRGEAMIGLNIAASGVRNLALFNDGSAAMQSMDGGVYIANRVAAPTGNPSGGGYLYVEGGALMYRGSSGTPTTIAPA